MKYVLFGNKIFAGTWHKLYMSTKNFEIMFAHLIDASMANEIDNIYNFISSHLGLRLKLPWAKMCFTAQKLEI